MPAERTLRLVRVSYNTKAMLVEVLARIAESRRMKVILVDNASSEMLVLYELRLTAAPAANAPKPRASNTFIDAGII